MGRPSASRYREADSPKERALGNSASIPNEEPLPCSLEAEVRRLKDTFLLFSPRLISSKKRSPIPVHHPSRPGIPEPILSSCMKHISVPVKVVEGFTYDAMNLSELLIAASGRSRWKARSFENP